MAMCSDLKNANFFSHQTGNISCENSISYRAAISLTQLFVDPSEGKICKFIARFSSRGSAKASPGVLQGVHQGP